MTCSSPGLPAQRTQSATSAEDPASACVSMVDALQLWAQRTPDKLAFGFLIDGVEEGPRLTYAELDRSARGIAVVLQTAAVPGERALLIYGPGLEFVAAFFACQYASLIPVPVYPPRLDRFTESWQGLARIAADCQPSLILTGGAIATFVSGSLGDIAVLRAAKCVVTDQVEQSAKEYRQPSIKSDELALIQYTSGSTAAPKGVMVSHYNLLHNERIIRAGFEHGHERMGISWLPPYHDMGLIGGILQVAYHGASCMLMPPTAILQNPLCWLQALSRYRGDTTGGPNFAYEHCVKRIPPEKRAGLDLSNWTVAAIGSETINPRTLESFTEAYKPCGFRPEAFYPCYGLAESTLFVTGGANMTCPSCER